MKTNLLLVLFACMLPFTVAEAQITTPKEGIPYVIHNSYGNGLLVLSRGTSNCIIETRATSNMNQQWYFEAADGAYKMKNKGTGEYVFLGTNDTWDLEFSTTMPATVNKGEYTFEALDSQYVAIKLQNNNKYYGTDASTSGAIVYCDKSLSNGGAKWYLDKEEAADIDGNGIININDAVMLIKKYILNLSTSSAKAHYANTAVDGQ